jgi:hypothetical protein
MIQIGLKYGTQRSKGLSTTKKPQYEQCLYGPILPETHDPSFSEAFNILMIENAKSFPPPPEGVTSRIRLPMETGYGT